ncbi:coiled-coil protein [Hymenobacter sp. DG25B]|uniref:hypothetical protein n=1 Tax=Hymenobacter sp. DG25B TaxID=1385664 RepID=UPI000540F529|nr:hypothetical protein [Hymenobacter sp. DG25B]AIZ63884.1 coiled-coil protein [Hymenobacter sp. DG25B]
MNIYFSDFFGIEPETLEAYGAFNISLINDLPVFIDPFLLFGSKDPVYQKLHEDILRYLAFLKQKSENGQVTEAQILAWYVFREVKQNWLGYSQIGNNGSGLGPKFGKTFSSSINIVFDDLGKEIITESSHLEKAGLFQTGIGKDNISDFTTNLTKEFLLNYTEKFALEHMLPTNVKIVKVDKVYFDYTLQRWMPKEFTLPFIFNDYVLLTPKNILTKDDNWINSHDLRGDFERICNSIPNSQLRAEIFNYFAEKLPSKPVDEKISQKERAAAIQATIMQFPDIIKLYLKSKEENKQGAKNISKQKVEEVESFFIRNIKALVERLLDNSNFYDIKPISSYEQSLNRLNYLKDVIEKNDGYRLFYMNGQPIKREEDLQIIYRLTWFASDFDVNRETNNGRGPVDYAVSKGSADKTLIEFKLASNSKLKQNLAKQVEVYEEANYTKSSIKVIMYFNQSEYMHLTSVLKELKLEDKENIILIDASPKASASNVTL